MKSDAFSCDTKLQIFLHVVSIPIKSVVFPLLQPV